MNLYNNNLQFWVAILSFAMLLYKNDLKKCLIVHKIVFIIFYILNESQFWKYNYMFKIYDSGVRQNSGTISGILDTI